MEMSWMHQHFNMILLLNFSYAFQLYADTIFCPNGSKLDIASTFKWAIAQCIKSTEKHISQ